MEIQVRTLAQHIWAAASHKLQYKHEASVPVPIRRSIYRASALLETVDMEFDRLLIGREAYLNTKLTTKTAEDILNVELVRSVLSELLPQQNMRPTEDYDDLLQDLNHFGLMTVEDLRTLIAQHLPMILKSEESYARSNNKKFYFQHVGLAREGLRAKFGAKVVTDYLMAKRA